VRQYYGLGAQDGVRKPLLDFDITKAFGVQNMVSNFAYNRWSHVYPILRAKIDGIHEASIEVINRVDQKALEIYNTKGVQECIDYVTDYSVDAADRLHDEWFKFYGELFVRFRDFLEIVPSDTAKSGCEIKENGLTDNWKERIIEETGDHYAIGDNKSANLHDNKQRDHGSEATQYGQVHYSVSAPSTVTCL
jgi:hypothetical protein